MLAEDFKKKADKKIEDEVTSRKNISTIKSVNDIVQKLIGSIKSIAITTDRNKQKQIDEFSKQINDVLDKETERYVSSDSGASGKDIAQFLNSTFAQNIRHPSIQGMRELLQNQSIVDLMNDQNAQVAVVLSDRYKNINSTYEDIRMVVEQLSELADVIDTMRDTITNSDNLIADISRIVSFGNDESTSSEKDLEIIRSMEKATGIKEKLKKIIIPETLKYGNFFVFTIPYTDLFAKFKAMDDRYNAIGLGGAGARSSRMRVGESWTMTDDSTNGLKAFYESYAPEITKTFPRKAGKAYTKEEFVRDMGAYLENIEVINDETIPLMEDSKIMTMADSTVRDAVQKAIQAKKNSKTWNPVGHDRAGKYSDGVISTHRQSLQDAEDKYKQEFRDVGGVFMKLYDPRRVVPVYIMDFCLGYYVLYESFQETTSNVLNAVHTLSRTSMLFQTDRRKEFENRLVSVIAERICASIDKPYLQKNAEFKELIANAISFDEFYRKSFRVQFVPANYITHFKVNEDPNTHMGISVLKRSLFYAMLYLTLLTFKIVMITTRSMDTRLIAIHTLGEDMDISGRVNEVISEYKENQISYNDFGSVRGVLSKVGKAHDIGIPIGPNGERAFDIEVMQGQEYELDTPLMDLLRKGMISNTGCPSAILNAMEDIDFARQLPMLHAKYVTRMVTMQEETEIPTTELYRKLIKFGGYEIDDDRIDSLTFKWARPKSINITNLTEMISNAEQLAEFMIKTLEGENSENVARVKDKYFKYIVTKMILPGVFDWDALEAEFQALELDMRADLQEEKLLAVKDEAQ